MPIDRRWAFGELVWPTSIKLPDPTKRQTLALSMDWKREALFGGAAGGGKSFYLLMAALQFADFPEYRALILRRTFKQLAISEGLLDLAQEWLANQAEGIDSVGGLPTRWIFRSGARLDFGHVQHYKDRTNYQGGAYHFVGVDELTQFLKGQYTYIAFSRGRRTVASSIPTRARATSNPGGEGHDWVRDRFLMHGAAIEPGKVGAYLSGRRAFIASKLRDNPYLDAADYEASLGELHPYERAMLMEGDWDAKPPGTLFQREWFTVLEQRPRVVRAIRYWDLAATEAEEGKDPDWTVGTLYARVEGSAVDYVVLDVQRFQLEPGELEGRMRSIMATDGPDVMQWIEQEGGSAGKIAARALGRELEGFTIGFERPTGSKVVRSGPVASAAQQGRVGILRAVWNEEWLRELEHFPGGSHDDQVDSLSGAHGKLAAPGGSTWDDLYPSSEGDSEAA